MKKKNTVASILKFVAIVVWAGGLFLASAIGGKWFVPVIYDTSFDAGIFLSILGISAVSGFFIFAFGEIISLLHKIVANTVKDN